MKDKKLRRMLGINKKVIHNFGNYRVVDTRLEIIDRIEKRLNRLENKISDVKKIQGMARKNQSRLDKTAHHLTAIEKVLEFHPGLHENQCEECGFLAKNKRGLSSHIAQKHKK